MCSEGEGRHRLKPPAAWRRARRSNRVYLATLARKLFDTVANFAVQSDEQQPSARAMVAAAARDGNCFIWAPVN